MTSVKPLVSTNRLLYNSGWVPLHAMKKRLFSWISWPFCFAAAIWLGFEEHWSGVAWSRLALVLSPSLFGWLFYWLPRWHMASLPKSEREAVMAKMKPKQREDILKWLGTRDAQQDLGHHEKDL